MKARKGRNSADEAGDPDSGRQPRCIRDTQHGSEEIYRLGRVNSADRGRVDACQRAKGAKGGRGRPRKTRWLGGKAISWEKGAGVTRARDFVRSDATRLDSIRLDSTRVEPRSRDAHRAHRQPGTHAYERADEACGTRGHGRGGRA